ncbi:hydroxymethylglutaryl-CoA lyase [Bosea sp. PAMC 26642]|uniref:hydroxymethylglutaryl-CoA lyase n=1 Tax=Bosea sp. (strain PAMC 26642) TaxID=1792307 RepID=UPI0007700F7B|nr:hydroxymethylglutaryl-CoA lyase [Bosea sp. PAMC 26642]AMJ61956.1 hydroxymethylglutaryl-CoA lyase [Bosea sp. PAMC 26642]
MGHVEIHEKGPREGFQFEKRAIETSRKIALIDALSASGLKRIQVAAFVNPQRVPGWADAEAVVAGIAERDGVEFTATCLNARGVQRALDTGRITIDGGVTTSASEPFLIRNQNQDFEKNKADLVTKIALYRQCGVTEFHAGVMAAFGCNFAGPITVDDLIASVQRLMAIAEQEGVRYSEIMLYDTMAWATPATIKTYVGAVQDRWPDIPVALHLHDTRGMGIANALAGLQMGVRKFDSSVAGLGGCPFAGHQGAAGNVCTEDLAFMCGDLGYETGVNLDALIEAALLAEEIVGHPLPGGIMHGGLLKTKVACG